jgi:hypothetical protein
MSLPQILQTCIGTIPAPIPYLRPKDELAAHWLQEIRKSAKCEVRSARAKASIPTSHIALRTSHLLVGVAWKGNPENRYDHQRSIPVTQFQRLAQVPGVKLISLQKDPAERLPAAITSLGGHFDEASGAFMDAAAVMTNLDLVIACDSAVAHLAGALAVPVWIALPLVPDWRWLLEREDSPWYPSMRLFRQTRYCCWDDVFERIARELKSAAN